MNPFSAFFLHVEVIGWRSFVRRPAIDHVPATVRNGHFYSQPATHFTLGPIRACVVWRNAKGGARGA